MSPESLPVATGTTKTTTARKSAETAAAGKMANSNANYRMKMEQQTGNQKAAAAAAAAVTSTATAAKVSAAAGNLNGLNVDLTSTPCAAVVAHNNKSNVVKVGEIKTAKTTTPTTTKATCLTVNATSVTNTTATANATSTATNVITSQCDSSSSGSSTASSSSNSSLNGDIPSSSSISVKSENCDSEIKTEMEMQENAAAAGAGGRGGAATTTTTTAATIAVLPNDANDLQLAAMKQEPILLSSMNAHIICGLCFGYLIDATTIVECLHSFCHSCLIKHLRTEQYCPRCEMMINTAKPNIKPDTTLQAIVYKLVPGLYEKELMRKRAFYKDRPEEAALATPEQRGDDTEHLIFSPSDYMSISLEYADTDELMKSNEEYNELLKARYLECPAMFTVAHLKKLVYGKFEINSQRFTIDIMYKVKTIILLDHYTLMDVAYIYTWKRDAPMRFYFRVKQSLRPAIRVKKPLAIAAAKGSPRQVAERAAAAAVTLSQPMCIVHEPTPSLVTTTGDDKLLEAEIKEEEIQLEDETEVSSTTEIPRATEKPAEKPKPKQFEIQPQSPNNNSQDLSPTDKLKITIVNKAAKEKINSDLKSPLGPPAPVKAAKEKKDSHKTSTTSPSAAASTTTTTATATMPPKDERKVENIKLKIDLSKQNSVTIINMSDPERKEIVKPVKHEKEWKVTKTKKEKDGSPKSSPKSSPHSDRKNKTPSPLTVPPITIKAERISPLAKQQQQTTSPTTPTSPKQLLQDLKKSQFLKSFALAPISEVKVDKAEQQSRLLSKEVTLSIVPKQPNKDMAPPPPASSSSKRKSKEPIKAVIKKPKLSPPFVMDHFKIKLPPIANQTSKGGNSNSSKSSSASKKDLMPPPAPLAVMKPPAAILKKINKLQSKILAAPPGSLTPHPMHGSGGIQLSAPGNRTPIAKRYQPILPKSSRPNQYASNIPSEVNKLLKDAGTEIKSIPNESQLPAATPKVYGPKAGDAASLMGPPPAMAPPPPPKTANNNSLATRNNASSTNKSSSLSAKTNSYLNLALFNATKSKSKGNEVPPGCRTPMYTPNSPIYSPSSPQYVPNYQIPTVPTYKYTPKPPAANNSNNSSYLQSVFSANSQMSSLFPSPPTKKDNSNNSTAASANHSAGSTSQCPMPKRVYPFARSPSPVEDPPEKQLKVKSLLNSCNINIPSSLSITITREDTDPSSNGGNGYPKHKSPVNNYIEILKLPEQTMTMTEQQQGSDNKRSSPPVTGGSLFPNPPVKRVATPPPPPPLINGNKGMNSNNNNNSGINMANSIAMNGSGINMTKNSKPPGVNKNLNCPNLQAMINNKSGPNNSTNKSSNLNSKLSTTTVSCHKSPPIPLSSDKKTPSPEKRANNSSSSEQKSPKSPDGSASKKFRHILPRQISANPPPPTVPQQQQQQEQQTEVNNAKQTGLVIGTYASPNGINVKIHSNKKVPASKKSPGSQQQQQQQKPSQQANNAASGKSSQIPPSTTTNQQQQTLQNLLSAPTNKTPTGGKSTNQTSKGGNKSNNNQVANKLNNNGTSTANMSSQLSQQQPSLPSVLPHNLQNILPPHLGAAAAAAASQAELSKFLKENLLRAQVQAAVANQSNMFYPYAANAAAAAQLGQFNPTMYNYQQAYIMDQLSRMQRAGNDAFAEYMQKLKNSMVVPKEGGGGESKGAGEGGKQTASQQKNTSPKGVNNNSSASLAAASSGTATTCGGAGKEPITGKSK